MDSAVLVAIITSFAWTIGIFAKLIFDYRKEKLKKKSQNITKESIDNMAIVRDTIDGIYWKYNCDRVFLALAHNGVVTVSNYSVKKMSTYYEVVNPSYSRISESSQNVNVIDQLFFVKTLLNNPHIAWDLEDKSCYQTFYDKALNELNILKRFKVKEFLYFPIMDWNNFIWFVGMHWIDNKNPFKWKLTDFKVDCNEVENMIIEIQTKLWIYFKRN